METNRNSPCPCGSGKRIKKCCAALDNCQELYEKGELNEALRCYQKAITENQENTHIYSKLGDLFKELGQVENAIASYKKAINLHPGNARLIIQLGMLYKKSGLKEEFDNSIKKALAIEHKSADEWVKFGLFLTEFGILKEADACYTQALRLKPDHQEAYCRHGESLIMQCMRDAADGFLTKSLELKPDQHRVKIHLATSSLINGDLQACRKHLDFVFNTSNISDTKYFSFVVPYKNFLDLLLDYSERNSREFAAIEGNAPKLFVIGDSHVLTMANLDVRFRGDNYTTKAKLIVGCKAWHLSNNEDNKYKYCFEKTIESIPEFSDVIFNIGEIDCRLNEGIIKNHKLLKNHLDEDIYHLVKNYINYVARKCAQRRLKPIICNIPMRLIGAEKVLPSDVELLKQVLSIYNSALASNCANHNIQILDVFSMSRNSYGCGKVDSHLDYFHLLPSVFKHLIGRL